MIEEKYKPQIIFQSEEGYFEVETSEDNLERMIKSDVANKNYVNNMVSKIKLGNKVNIEKYEKIGGQMPINRTFTVNKNISPKEKLIQELGEFFNIAITYADVYKSDYILIEKLGVYIDEQGDKRRYVISGLSELLIDKEKIKHKFFKL